MSIPTALDTLIDLATRDTDDAATRLGQAMKVAADAEQKLTLLTDYRGDYVARFQDTMNQGISALTLLNFQKFIEKLDSAIVGQQQTLRDMQSRVEQARRDWQECERKRMSFGTLALRAQQKLVLKEIRRDQKQTDEHAARQLMRAKK